MRCRRIQRCTRITIAGTAQAAGMRYQVHAGRNMTTHPKVQKVVMTLLTRT